MAENGKGVFCEVSCQHLIVYAVRVDESQGRHIVADELTAVFGFHKVLGEGFKSVSSKIRIIATTGGQETTHQVIKLLLVNLLLSTLGNNAASTDVIKVVEELGGVALHLIRINGIEGLDRLTFETYIIIIGGVDDGILRLCIEQALQVVIGKGIALFIDATDSLIGQLAELMELTIAGTALTEAHLLDVGDETLDLMIGGLDHFCEKALCLVIFHPDDMNKSKVVEGLCPTRTIACSELYCALGISLGRINIAVVIGIRKRIQLVDRMPIWTVTG